MSLVSVLSTLTTRIGTEIKGLVRPTHPGLARAWVSFGYVLSSMRINSSYNVSSVTRTAAGRYRVTFATPIADANYCWVVTARSSNINNTFIYATARLNESKSTTVLDVACMANTAALTDATEINVVVFR